MRLGWVTRVTLNSSGGSKFMARIDDLDRLIDQNIKD